MKSHIVHFYLPAIIAAVCLGIAYSPETVSLALRYDAEKIPSGDYWRILTAHFVHLSLPHLYLNLGGLLLVFIFFSKCLSLKYWLTCLFVSAIGISLLVFNLNPDITWYVGLSGVLHALFILGGVADIQFRKWEGIGFTLIILSKVIFEQFSGPLPGSEETAGGPVLVDAHFYGAMIGLALSAPIVYSLFKNHKQKQNND